MASVLLSEGEKQYIIHGIQDNFRIDGRGREDYQCIEVETDIVTNASGSARLRLANTDVLVGVKAEIGEPHIETPTKGSLKFFIDCSATATPEFEGRGGDDLAASISSMLHRAYADSKGIDLRILCIVPHEKCWLLHVDIVLLQCGGNLTDAVSLAVKAALYNTRLPNWQVVNADTDDVDINFNDDTLDFVRLPVSNAPCIVTLNKIGRYHIVDATSEEETCCLARLMIGVTQKGHVTAVLKEAGGSLDIDSINDMIDTASRVGPQLHRDLMAALKRDESTGFVRHRTSFLA